MQNGNLIFLFCLALHKNSKRDKLSRKNETAIIADIVIVVIIEVLKCVPLLLESSAIIFRMELE